MEIDMWSAYLLRKKGIPVGDKADMNKAVARLQKAQRAKERQDIIDSIHWT